MVVGSGPAESKGKGRRGWEPVRGKGQPWSGGGVYPFRLVVLSTGVGDLPLTSGPRKELDAFPALGRVVVWKEMKEIPRE